MNSRPQALLLCLFASLAVATDYVEFSVVQRIKFFVPGNWPVISSKSTPEKTTFAFQIPNRADKKTPDSSNLVIVSSYLSNAQEKEDFEKTASTIENNATDQKLVVGWGCQTFTGMQKSTQYVVWDCYREVADCGVKVRIAWPHLPKNPPDYDKQMEAVLSDFLSSVTPSKPLDPASKGVLRRNEEPH
jgi:hypothetical protein